MKLLTLLASAVVASIALQVPAQAAPRVGKVYGANGRRVAVIKDSSFGQRVYDERGRRVAVIKSR